MDQVQTVIADDPAATGWVYGLGPAMLALNSMAAEIARSDISVLIVGESGSGKDALARLIHRLSSRADSKLHKINCSAFEPGDLLNCAKEAMRAPSTVDKLQTVYLDNIQELDLACQRVLLSQLPEGETAGSKDEPNVRFISSTTRNLESEVVAGQFRRELYFRLNGVCLRIPPLRERIEDIPALAEYFLTKYSAALKKNSPPLTDEAVKVLSVYNWPGNIRELENLARKIVVFGDVQMAMNDLRAVGPVTAIQSGVAQGSSLKLAARAASKKAERELILQALERTHWNRKRAARDLQISYKSLLYKIKQIGVSNGKQGG